MGTHGSMTIYTASEESDDPEQSAYVVKLHTTHDGDALTALRDALLLPFFALQEFENEGALALARGESASPRDWRSRMALAAALLPGRRNRAPTRPDLDPLSRRAFFLRQAFELCNDGAAQGHWFSADPTALCLLMTKRASAGWFSLPHQLDQDTADYWGGEPDLLIESGSDALTRVSLAWPDPESEEGRDEMFEAASRWVREINAALSPFSLYEIERLEDGVLVQYPFEISMTALFWHRAFAGGRLDPIESEDGPYGYEGQQSALKGAFGADPTSDSVPAFSDLTFCFSSSTPASQDRHSAWARIGEFTGARRPEARAQIDKGGALIATDFLSLDEPLLARAALRSLEALNQSEEPGVIADWLRSVMDQLPERTRHCAPEALAFLEQADLARAVAAASPARGQPHSI